MRFVGDSEQTKCVPHVMKHLAVHGLYRAGSTNERLSLADVADEVNGATINTDVRFDKHFAGSTREGLRILSAKVNLAD